MPHTHAIDAFESTAFVTAVLVIFDAGQRAFGENYAQELRDKSALLAEDPPLQAPPEWHFIGPLQSNKTRAIAENFAWVHSVDRAKIAERLSAAHRRRRPPVTMPPACKSPSADSSATVTRT